MQPIKKEPPSADKAYTKLSARCAMAETAPADVARKMAEWGMDERDIAKVMERLTREGFLDETRYMKAYINDKLRFARWGRRKITMGLYQKGIKGKAVTQALADIDETAYRETLQQLIEARRRTERKATGYALRAKLMRFGVSRGFEPGLVSDVIDDVVADADEDDVDW